MTYPAAESLCRVLLPIELAEAELRARPVAAVMVLLRRTRRGLEILLAERARREGDPWSGQVGLPGGRRHRKDGTILETALRETEEEVGLDLDGKAEILGHMPPRAPGKKPEMLAGPYVALARTSMAPTAGSEVVSTFWCPPAALPPTRTTAVVSTILGELTVPAFRDEGELIWGFTYRLLEELLVLVPTTAVKFPVIYRLAGYLEATSHASSAVRPDPFRHAVARFHDGLLVRVLAASAIFAAVAYVFADGIVRFAGGDAASVAIYRSALPGVVLFAVFLANAVFAMAFRRVRAMAILLVAAATLNYVLGVVLSMTFGPNAIVLGFVVSALFLAVASSAYVLRLRKSADYAYYAAF